MRDTAASLGLPMVVTYGSALQERIVCMRHSTDTDTTPLEVQIDLAHAFSMSPAAHTLCDKTGTLPGIRLTADASACTDVGFESPCSELSSPSVLAPDDSPSSIRHRLRAVMPSKEDFARNPHGPLLLTRNPLAPHQVGYFSSPPAPAVIPPAALAGPGHVPPCAKLLLTLSCMVLAGCGRLQQPNGWCVLQPPGAGAH